MLVTWSESSLVRLFLGLEGNQLIESPLLPLGLLIIFG
ncbi:hypothetical protein ALQ16_205247 [Pseudomonas syringae pv. actinidiae]|uniref:Uncharacterized protein n=1 Tax=Pseudomonas syringae pv. actinidiae TaxID=103796 RepID=A0AAN4QCK1_PSESF|nr:hypothetical protein ALQ16_205247 [Pseudomonas syringae pv. actinidiae]GBH21553.1 hypothetical protein KPSA3_07601 [Pseudomonas syringae pv. actinidiae]